MTDIASLSFDIDSSQAQRAISVLETLKATSISVAQASQQQTAAAKPLTQIYDQQRDQIGRLSDQTRSYDGTLQGLIGRVNSFRQVMNDSQAAANAFGRSLVEATAAANTFNASIAGLERYVATANQLKVSFADIATGFERITAALQNQTQAGVAARTALSGLGVSLQGMGPNQSDQVLQALADQLRKYQMTSNTIGLAQQVLGPSADARALIALQNQPYRPTQQRIELDRQSASQAQIATQQEQILRLTASLDRQNARRADLAGMYSENHTFLGRLGITGNGYGETANQRSQRLETIAALPPSERGRYENYGYQISRFLDTNAVTGAVRNFTSGRFSSNEDEINLRERQDANNSRWGIWGATPVALGRRLTNLVGGYTPLLDRDSRELSPGDRQMLRAQSGTILSNLGDNSLANISNLELRQQQVADPTTRKRYVDTFGDMEGQRQYTNLLGQTGQDLAYARGGEQRVIDDTNRQQLLLALPQEQRAEAQFRLGAIGQLAGSAATVMPVGTSIEGLRGTAALNKPMRDAVTGQFNQQVAGQMQGNTERNNDEITFQKQLAEALDGGRAAAENFTRAWSAYRQAQLAGASETQATAQGLETVGVALQQRITQGKALVVQEKLENDATQQRIQQARGLVGADPIVRRAAELSMGIGIETTNRISAGQLPDPNGGTFKGQTISAQGAQAIIGADEAQRMQAVAQGGTSTALALQNRGSDAVGDAKRVADLMSQQLLTMQQASQQLETEKQFRDAIASAQKDTTGAAENEVKARMAITTELQRQADLQNARAANLQGAQGFAQDGQLNDILARIPASDRDFVRRVAPNLYNTINAGNVRISDDQRSRASTYSARLEKDLGVTHAAGMADAAYAIGESGIRGINEDKRSIAVPGSKGGFGYLQWTAERRTNFESFARAHNLDPASDEANIQFHEFELSHSDPALLTRMRTPGISAADQASGFAHYVYGNDPKLNANVPARRAMAASLAGDGTPSGTPSIAGGGTPGTSNAQVEGAIVAAIHGQPMNLDGLPPDVIESLQKLATSAKTASYSGQKLGVVSEGEGIQARIDQIRRQTALAGNPGLQARQVALNPSLPGDLAQTQAANQTAGIVAGQGLQVRNAGAVTDQSIVNLEREAKAAQQGAGALDLLTSRLKAEQEQQQLGMSDADTRIRQLQLETEAMEKLAAATEQRTLAARNQLTNERGLTGAAYGGPVALVNQQIATRNADQERMLLEQRGLTTDKDKIALIDQQIERLRTLTIAEQAAAAQQRQTQAAAEVHSIYARNNIQADTNAAGIFAVPRDIQRARDQGELNQRFRDDPTLANSREGFNLVQANEAKQAMADQTDEINAARDAAHGLQSSLEGALTQLVTTGGHGVDILKNLRVAMEEIALRQFVFRPFEQALSAMTGGGGNGNGGGNGGGGDGVAGAMTRALTGGASTGGDGTGSGTAPSDTLAGVTGRATTLAMTDATNNVADVQSNGGDSGGSSGGGSSWDNFTSGVGRVLGHAGGVGGYLADKSFGQGFYQNGGFLGVNGLNLPSWLGGSSAAVRDQYDFNQGSLLTGSAAGYGGSGGSGGAADAGYITPPIPPPEPPAATMDFSSMGSDIPDAFAALGGIFPRGSGNSHISAYENEIINSPTLFRFAKGGSFGMMGEAGPEAVMPLKKGPNGTLGVSVHGGMHSAPPVVFNIQTPNADSFVRSQAQIHARASAAVNRSQARNAL